MVLKIMYEDFGTIQDTKDAINRICQMKPQWFKVMVDQIMNIVADFARAFCPIDTGALVSTIRVETPRAISEIPVLVKAIGPDVQSIQKTVVAGDEMVDYALYVHDGHVAKNGTWVPPQPFLTDAWMASQPEIERLIFNYLAEIEREWAKQKAIGGLII